MKLVFSVLFILILNGCSSKPPADRFISNLNRKLNFSGQIKGDLIAKYDLLNISPSKICFYNKDYVKIINEANSNNNFIAKALVKFDKNSKLIERNIFAKTKKIAKFAKIIDYQHSFLSLKERKTVDLIINANQISHPEKKLIYLEGIIKKIPFVSPLFKFQITSQYGYRQHPLRKVKKFHAGVDLAGVSRSPVYAAAEGRVINVDEVKGYGKVIDIEHGKFISRYAHLSQIIVRSGEMVFQGQKIGVQGKSGQVTNEHLHFEVIQQHKHFNPINLIQNPCSTQTK